MIRLLEFSKLEAGSLGIQKTSKVDAGKTTVPEEGTRHASNPP
jgi:hypothetical protein